MICLVSALLLGMASCGDSQQKRLRLSKQEKARLDSIDRASLKVGVMPTLDCLPVYLAYEDSIFLKQGVTVHLYRYNAQMDCDTAIARKEVEGTVTDLVKLPACRSRVHSSSILSLPICTGSLSPTARHVSRS